jgi:hypothetical protein
MKLFAGSLLIIIFSVAPVFAGFELGVSGGYTLVSMKNLNSNIDTVYNKAISDPTVLFASKQHVTDGLFGCLDAGYSFIPGLSAGARFEYLCTLDAQMKVNTTGFLTTTAATADISASLIPVMAGVSYTYSLPGLPLSIGAEVYAGYGFADLSINTDMETGYLAGTTVESFDGGCFVFDSAFKINYIFNQLFSAGLNIGYRTANVTKLKYTQVGINLPNYADYGKALQLDYTGMKFGAAVNFSF